MSSAPAPAGQAIFSAVRRSENRSDRRYPIKLDLNYNLLSRGYQGRSGTAKTVNIASGGVLIEACEPLPAGCQIELIVSWPFLLEGVCPLKLVIRGRIVRSNGTSVAIKAKHHEFRTAGARAQKSKPPEVRVRSMTG